MCIPTPGSHYVIKEMEIHWFKAIKRNGAVVHVLNFTDKNSDMGLCLMSPHLHTFVIIPKTTPSLTYQLAVPFEHSLKVQQILGE